MSEKLDISNKACSPSVDPLFDISRGESAQNFAPRFCAEIKCGRREAALKVRCHSIEGKERRIFWRKKLRPPKLCRRDRENAFLPPPSLPHDRVHFPEVSKLAFTSLQFHTLGPFSNDVSQIFEILDPLPLLSVPNPHNLPSFDRKLGNPLPPLIFLTSLCSLY